MCKTNPFRGAFIVLEGCDRSGKTTQCKQLGKFLIGFIIKYTKIEKEMVNLSEIFGGTWKKSTVYELSGSDN